MSPITQVAPKPDNPLLLRKPAKFKAHKKKVFYCKLISVTDKNVRAVKKPCSKDNRETLNCRSSNSVIKVDSFNKAEEEYLEDAFLSLS